MKLMGILALNINHQLTDRGTGCSNAVQTQTLPATHSMEARGVFVCNRWYVFENFLEDMGERPEGMTLGRYCDLSHYEPQGCAWMTMDEQMLARQNKRALAAFAGGR
jgi:hypothetical protein